MKEEWFSLLLILLLITWSPLIGIVNASSGTGTVTVNQGSPTIVSRSISSSVDGANITSGNLDVNTKYWYWVEISHPNTLEYVDEVYLYLYTSGGTRGVFNKQLSYGFRWLAQNPGVITGATWTTGVSGSALNFGGDGDRVEISHHDDLQNPSQITIEVYIRPTGKTGQQNIADKRDSNGGWQVRVDGSGYPLDFIFILKDSSGIEHGEYVPGLITLNEWNHLICTYDGSYKAIYKWNEASGTFEEKGRWNLGSIDITQTSTSIWIGASPDGSFSFQGDIDELRIYNRALTIPEMNNNHNGEVTYSGLVGWWKFDEGSGDRTWAEPIWQELSAAGWTDDLTFLSREDSVSPTLTGNSGTWKFAVTVAKVARNVGVAAAWLVNTTVVDKAGHVASKEAGWYDYNYYVEYTLSSPSVTWGVLDPGTSNNEAQNMPLTITVVAVNHESYLQFKGDGNLTDGKGHTMPLSSVTVGMTGPSDGIQLSTSYQTLCSVSPGENINIETRWYISIPSAQYPGTYTFTWYVTMTSA